MMIKEKKAQAVSMLNELSQIKKPVYSARDLHQRKAMLSMVQRQEQRRYMRQVMAQKTKLKKDIFDIDKYLQSVSDYESYEADLPKKNGNGKGIKAVSLLTAPAILPVPKIVSGQRPVLKRTRLYGYKRRSKY